MIVDQGHAKLRSKQTPDRLQAVKAILGREPSEREALLLEALSDKLPYVAALAAEALSMWRRVSGENFGRSKDRDIAGVPLRSARRP